MTIVEKGNGGRVTGEEDLSNLKSGGASIEFQSSVEVSVDGFVDDKIMNPGENSDTGEGTGGKNNVMAASDHAKTSGHGANSHTIVSGTSSTEHGVAVDDIPSSTVNGTGTSKKEDASPLKVGKSLVTADTEFCVTASELSELTNERTRLALAEVLDVGIKRGEQKLVGNEDEEAPSAKQSTWAELRKTAQSIRETEEGAEEGDISHAQKLEEDKVAEIAAIYVVNVLLKSSVQSGIDSSEVEIRKEIFGSNAIADKELDSFLQLCWEAVQDFVLIMLIVLGLITIVIETALHEDEEETASNQSEHTWIEGAAILFTVGVVVLVTAGIDYAKQFAFIRLTKSLNETNTKSVIRNGKQVSIVDDDIVVGDIISVNSHNLASIPADCILLGPSTDLFVDESTLTGESVQIRKKPGDIILSGTTAVQGSGKMAVIAVGINSVAGKIRARVYESGDHEDELGDGDENSPLFVKLDLLAKQIGLAGTVASCIAFVASALIGLLLKDDPNSELVKYMTVAITVLAVAVPEGLPLAVTLALAFSSNKMMSEQNLVKHLDVCETMGCATTICTDKTGTLTANKMTARAFFVLGRNYLVTDPAVTLSKYMMDNNIAPEVIDIVCKIIAIDTMNETVLTIDADGEFESSQGNPTEVALLIMVHQLGVNYEKIRNTTAGRSSVDGFVERLSEGKQFEFTSARKMMSWAVPKDGGGHRVYIKGAQEVIVGRSNRYLDEHGREQDMDENLRNEFIDVAVAYSRRGMRCLALAYRDLEQGADLEELSTTVTNSDGTHAFVVETDVVIVGLVGIEDPLRAEVPRAIQQCYEAGIDVRMVTGDNANTAVSIAYQAGILRESHFVAEEKVAMNLKEHVLMEGKEFRKRVYRINEDGTKEFDQAAFDRIWPFLRVLARSSPDDKLTLAHGLNQSTLFTDEKVVETMRREHDIIIFPDRQVVAMTGDGTNDAPALKRSDIGFAMGISGTQIAKDAADIILLDDNFASIVTAAKWGRNVYDSIQKFLQFQLTVNMAAVVTALVGAFFYQTSPLAAIQLLWVNLLMDSLASLALASEPPVDELLQRPPVNRTEHMITYRMWANMLGQAGYQIVVIMILLFMGPDLLDIEKGHVEEDDGINSTHYTLIFNSFVWMQLFNEINCRNLKGQFNVFSGMFNNPLFCGIVFTTAVMQVLIVQFGSYALSVHVDGLSLNFWALSIAIGAGSLPVQQVINVVYLMGKGYKKWRMKPRVQKSGAMSTRTANGSHPHSE